MSQRLCAGFNCPPLAIPAEEPVSIAPEAVSRAGQFVASCATTSSVSVEILPSLNLPPKYPPLWSRTLHVGHVANTA